METEPRRWWQKKRLVIPLGVAAVLVVVGGLSDTDEDPVRAAATATTVRVTTTEAPTTTVAPTWQEVARLEGTTNKRGEVFTLPDGEARMRYEVGEGFFAVYIMDEGASLEKDGGFPEVTCIKPCADETRLAKDAGRYYLETNTAAPYTVIVEVLR